MKPKPRSDDGQLALFRAQFQQLLNLKHPLCSSGVNASAAFSGTIGPPVPQSIVVQAC